LDYFQDGVLGLVDSFFVFTNLCVHDFAFGDDIACGLGAMF